jgi:lysophospholipase L1-like esterase
METRRPPIEAQAFPGNALAGGMTMRRTAYVLCAVFLVFSQPAWSQGTQPGNQKWVATWAASVHGPYPVGNPSAQPDQRFAFPDPAAGAKDQTMRLIVRPSIWGREMRIRLTNVFGTKPVTFDGAYVGLQLGGPAIAKGTNRPIKFAGRDTITLAPGSSIWSDGVTLDFVHDPESMDLASRKLAVSFHIAGESGPMTWHAKALTTSYVSPPGSGSHGKSEDETAFPYGTSSWFFMDAIEMMSPANSFAIVTFGDSITDGTASTMNGDDRWPDVLSRRLRALHGNRIAIVNAGIGGNQVTGPVEYSPQKPYNGGPSARMRIDRDVLELSGVTHMIWLEGINDFSTNGNASLEKVRDGMTDIISHIRSRRADLRIIGATVITSLGSANHGTREQDAKRRGLNDFIRNSGLFDGVADFDRVTIDLPTGALKPEFIPDSTVGRPGDNLHPNRAGYLAMGMAIDLDLFRPK